MKWSLMLERFTEVSHLKCQEGWERLNICKIFQKTTTNNNMVLRRPYSELISINFVLKLYFEKSHWRKWQKHRWGTFHKLCPYICATVRDHVDLYCLVLQSSRCDTWIPTITPVYVFPQSVLAYDIFTNADNYRTTHTSHNGQKKVNFINNYLFAYILVIDCDILCVRYHERLLYVW